MTAGSRSRLLALIPYETAVTMADLVRISGLSLPTLADMLHRLQAEGAVLCEPAVASGGRGRPAQRWRRRPPRGMFAALAFSRDSVRVRVANTDDQASVEREETLNVALNAMGALDGGHRLRTNAWRHWTRPWSR